MTRKSTCMSFLIQVANRDVCEFHFPCRVFTRPLSSEEQAYITFLADERDVSVKEISQKTGISPATIRPTNNT